MIIAEYIFTSVVILFVIIGVFYLFRLATKKRQRSIETYLHEKELRKQKLMNS